MIVLGLNIFHGDSSACLVVDGKLKSAVEEERFTRIKHSSEFPINAIKFCLENNKVNFHDVDYISVNYNIRYNFYSRFFFLIKNIFKINFISNRTDSIIDSLNIKEKLKDYFSETIKAKIVYVPHHLAHAYSTFFFLKKNENSLIFSFDGSGDFSTIESYIYKKNELKILKKINFPHSLGLFYSSFVQFIGFEKYGDEYKFMGLAGYGKPIYYNEVKKMIKSQDPFKLDMRYFNLPKVDYSNKYPMYNNLFNKKFEFHFRKKFNLVDINYKNQFSKDLACSVQTVFEECVLKMLKNIREKQNIENIYLAGGCAFNSSLIGKIIETKMFRRVSVDVNPGDAGGAVGAAFYACEKNKIKISALQNHQFLGPSFSNSYIKENLIDKIKNIEKYKITFFDDFDEVATNVAQIISDENIIFWFQDRMEWGPRALGNRSILANPAVKNIKEIINKNIKKRELFRPFAPSIMEEYANEYFYMHEHISPNMNIVFQAKDKTKITFPEVVHVDNTSRVQTVSKENNGKFYSLLKSFQKITGSPLLINTSMNIDAPIVLSPLQAFETFLETDVKTLVLNNYIIQKIK